MLSINYAPDKTGIAVTTTEVAEWFSEKGDNVTVITALPYYPEWKINEAYRHKSKRNENIKGVSIFRVNLFVPQKLNTIKRILHELSFVFFTFFKAVRLKKPDVIVVVSPPLFLGLIVIILKYVWKRKLLLNIKDLVPDAAIELNMLKSPVFIRILYVIERFIYKHSDAIASLGHGVLNRLEKKGVPRAKLHYLPDTADPQLLSSPHKTKAANLFLTSNKIKADFIVLHSGNMGVKQGIPVIIYAASLLKEKPICFYIVGDGGEKEKIIELTKSLHLNNVRFLPLQPREHLADMYHAADISLVTQMKEVIDIVVPSKLVSMMAAGSCVIASTASDSEAAKIVLDADCGVIVPPENSEKLAEAILSFYNHQETIEQKRINARKYISKWYDREQVMQTFNNLLESLHHK